MVHYWYWHFYALPSYLLVTFYTGEQREVHEVENRLTEGSKSIPVGMIVRGRVFSFIPRNFMKIYLKLCIKGDFNVDICSLLFRKKVIHDKGGQCPYEKSMGGWT